MAEVASQHAAWVFINCKDDVPTAGEMLPDGSIEKLRQATLCCTVTEVGQLTSHVNHPVSLHPRKKQVIQK